MSPTSKKRKNRHLSSLKRAAIASTQQTLLPPKSSNEAEVASLTARHLRVLRASAVKSSPSENLSYLRHDFTRGQRSALNALPCSMLSIQCNKGRFCVRSKVVG